MPHATTWRDRLTETLAYLAWAYLPSTTLSVPQLYELISTNTIAQDGLYINLGYWKAARTSDEACAAMVELLAHKIQLAADDVLLDVGFGFAEQDMYWMTHIGPRRIVGINIVASQVIAARKRLISRHLADRIQLQLASATELPFESACFSAVTAVECAFHFDTRERFFAEAQRVLRPGGRLVLGDIIPKPTPRSWSARWHHTQSWQAFSRTWAAPVANAYPRAVYADKLAAAGFVNVQIESIREHVFPGYHHYCTTQPDYLRRFNPVIRLHHQLARVLGEQTIYGAFDYVIATAQKAAPPAHQM